MFHLFKKVYLDFDDKISMSYDRIICSEEHGGIEDAHDLSKVFYGEKLATGKTINDIVGEDKQYPTFLSMLEALNTRADETQSPTFIYCDKTSYYQLAIKWMKIVLPFASDSSAWKFFKAHIFKEKNFVNSRWSSRYPKTTKSWSVAEAEFSQLWATTTVSTEERKSFKNFVESVIDGCGVEFLLAGYIYDGRYSDHLAKVITPLVKTDLENFLYELKEIILVHFQHPWFQEHLGVVNGPYTFDNFYDMIDDPSPMVKVMFDPKIWGEERSSAYAPSSKGTIHLSEITDQNIEQLKNFAQAAGKVWAEQQWHTLVKSENSKLDFIKMFKNKDVLSVEDLEEILDFETRNILNQAAGSFYAVDLYTVNTYFIDFVLQHVENKEALKPYVFEIPH